MIVQVEAVQIAQLEADRNRWQALAAALVVTHARKGQLRLTKGQLAKSIGREVKYTGDGEGGTIFTVTAKPDERTVSVDAPA